ncbi:hypothetical protein ASPFODRAFT_204661 [Aspergillus luchuensis CBS 106.47]|uniref:Uncharacterized protein n=1 Tax=Aspergillus luchuensis (strain CBS 106.47) TaxID=1137211 RepID=A0A1M3TSM4_ASPLC|nr:hypothetical protein ASPFODRAFT_204661 [Aspergillus luchuensis CBS 106.47]
MEHELLLGVLNVVIDAWEIKFHPLEVQGSEESREYTEWESHNRVLFDDVDHNVDHICRVLKASKSVPSTHISAKIFTKGPNNCMVLVMSYLISSAGLDLQALCRNLHLLFPATSRNIQK